MRPRTSAFVSLVLLGVLVAILPSCDSGSQQVVQVLTGTVSGTVTADGEPLAGVTVTLSSGATTTTSSSGAYAFTDVPAGAYTATISGAPPDVEFDATSQAAVITSAGQVATVDFQGHHLAPGSIQGAVKVNGTGLEGVGVTATHQDVDQVLNATTDANGAYRIDGVRPGHVQVAIDGYGPESIFDQTTQDVDVASGATARADFDGTPTPGGIKVGVTMDGQPAQGFWVQVNTPDGITVERSQTDASGQDVISSTLDAGQYVVSVILDAGGNAVSCGGSQTVTVSAGQTSQVTFACSSAPSELLFSFDESGMSGTPNPGTTFDTPLRDSDGTQHGTVTTTIDQGIFRFLSDGSVEVHSDAVFDFAVPDAYLGVYNHFQLFVSQVDLGSECSLEVAYISSDGTVLSTQEFSNPLGVLDLTMPAGTASVSFGFLARTGYGYSGTGCTGRTITITGGAFVQGS